MSNLYEYGIMQENSDVRAHVAPATKRVYVFPTRAARTAIKQGDYRIASASQNGVNGATAQGWLVPPDDIEGCIAIRVRPPIWSYLDFRRNEPTPVRGEKATKLVCGMLRRGLFPLPALQRTDLSLEVNGTDIIAEVEEHQRLIQVKCDFNAGHRAFGGTGNLYLQKSERNPKRLFEGEQVLNF
jgi:hypothetical protein